MNKPWNVKLDDDRYADSLPIFIIFCEDEISEPIYFKYFETSNIKVNIVKKQKSKIDNVLRAICYCTDKGFIKPNNGVSCLQNDDIHIWCVFDRDIEETSQKIKLGNVSFNESIKTAEASSIKTAWSNDAFELWILLHFEDVDINNNDYKNRKTYYKRLTEIFKNLPNPNEDLIKSLAHLSFSYKQDLKHKNNFRNIVRNEIINKTNNALKRAKALEKHYKSNTANHEKAPCTLVHHLIDELVRIGGKKI